MPYLINQCCHLIYPYACAHHSVLVNKAKLFLDILEQRTRRVFLGAAKRFEFRIEISNKHDIVRYVVDGLKVSDYYFHLGSKWLPK